MAMTEKEEPDVRLLSGATNASVVQLPSRKFPGIVLQGDTLASMCDRIQKINAHLMASDTTPIQENDEALEALESLTTQLSTLIKHYEDVLNKEGVRLPCGNRSQQVSMR